MAISETPTTTESPTTNEAPATTEGPTATTAEAATTTSPPERAPTPAPTRTPPLATAASSVEPLSIGEVAERTGLSVHALRFYEREGLLVGPVARTSGGRRRYSAVDVDWLQICVKLRESGMPLADLERFAELVRRGPGNEAERTALLDGHRRRVDAQIQALEECRSLIAWKVGVYAEHLDRGRADGLWDPTA